MAPTNKVTDLFRVDGMVVVITGGGSGLGLYAARALDANGAKAVYIVGRREETLKSAAKTGVNGTIKYIVGDVTDKASLRKVADQVKQEQGFINLLFANSGVTGPKYEPEVGSKLSVKQFADALLEPAAEEYTQVQHVNVTGVFLSALTFLELLDAGNKKRNVPQDSQILVTSSIAGFSRQLGGSFAYSTSKAGVTHLIKMLATTFAQQGYRIRANIIAPGLYPSEMTQAGVSKLDNFGTPDGHRAFEGAHVLPKERSPSERTGSEEDFAATVLFYASRAGAYLNGVALVTDGGRLSQLPATY
ncbi:hypothetical protein DOTSEDRAFT_69231 [Dothistroma septosporum NZE10]|uniref:Uncharacterized protein n=1 Tax=Dothistroma septosporum (strain NZE10 / CBS 128990) TaxID=675120 RepID=N1PW73_DOTSN|nr:hypothetical protein DOTSEDRAFT_69231 [Dothistroma septosporum NZE10]